MCVTTKLSDSAGYNRNICSIDFNWYTSCGHIKPQCIHYKCVWTLNFNTLLSPPGGRQGKMPVTALEVFDLEMKSWTRYSCIPSRRAFSCCATNERSLFSLGGLQQPGPHNFYSRPHFVSTMEEYDLDQGKWILLYNIIIIINIKYYSKLRHQELSLLCSL